MKIFYIVFLLSFFVFLASCTCSGGRNRTDSQWTTDMAKQNNVKPQEASDSGEILMNEPPEGTRARNRRYYPYSRKPLEAGKKLKNPLKNSAEVLAKGKTYYKRYCIYCHGDRGDAGEGALVASKMFIKPLSLLTNKAKSYSDGRIYHIIYEGQGLMGAYRVQLETNEQVIMNHYIKGEKTGKYRGSDSIWSVVHYVRFLQRAGKKNRGMK